MYKMTPIPQELLIDEPITPIEQNTTDNIIDAFYDPVSTVVLWSNGGRLWRLAIENKPPYCAGIYTEFKDKSKIKRLAQYRLKNIRFYPCRLFVEGYKLNKTDYNLINNSGIEILTIE